MKPQEFFVGFREFVAILVPGLALFLLFPAVGNLLGQRLHRALPGPEAGSALTLAILLAAYGLGTLVAAGASLIDRPVDRKLIAPGGGAVRRTLRRVFLLTKAGEELAQMASYAEALEVEVLSASTHVESEGFWKARSFWWSYMRLNSPAAIAELDKIEGHQKLFRALAPLALVAGAVAVAETGSPVDATVAVLLALCLCWAFLTLYMRLRVSFTSRLFQMVIVTALPDHALRTAAASLRDGSGCPGA